MIAQYARHEEEWVPVSDWGRAEKARREAQQPVKRAKVVKIREPRVKKPKQPAARRAGRPVGPFVSAMKCEKCETMIRSDNTKGLCQKHSKELWNLSMKGKRGKKAA